MKSNIIILSILTASLAFTACQDKLDEHVYSQLTPELAFTSGENAQAATNEIYESLHSTFRTPYFYINDMDSDVGYRNGQDFETLNDEAIKTSSENSSYWDGLYKVVSRANIVLDNVPEMSEGHFADVSPKKQMVAEAHFMRAFAYLLLTDAYYRVPLVTDSKEDLWSPSECSELEDIEKVIEDDLVAAIPDLPKTFPNTEASRPTTGAARAYLGRLYMRQAGRARIAGEASAATEKWKKAQAQIDAVLAMEHDPYELLPNVADIYVANTDAGRYNKEIVFAVRSTDKVNNGSWDIGLGWTPWDCNYGWSTFSVPLELAWQFEEGDTRFASDMMFTTFTRYNRTDKPKYKNCIFFFPESIEKVGLTIKEFKESHPDVTLETKSAENDAAYTRKYEYYQAGTYNYNTPNNAILCRFADIILCKAEIENELNGPANALPYLNRIRERAFKNADHNYTAADFSGKDSFRSALCDERALEFHSEGTRRPDLIRMGLWKDRMDKYIASIKRKAEMKEKNENRESGYYRSMYQAYPTDLKEKDIRMYMPIPHRELGANPDLANARNFE